MAMRTWRLVVTALGQGASSPGGADSGGAGEAAAGSGASRDAGGPLHEVTVEAENWMTALRHARAAIGESGGVPTGASCAIAPDGRVTILDPVTRRSYVVAPGTSHSFRPTAATSGPRVPGDEVPRAITPTAQVATAQVATAQVAAAQAAAAPVAAAPTVETSRPVTAAATTTARAKSMTMAYMPTPSGVRPEPIAIGVPASPAATTPADVAPREPIATPAEAAPAQAAAPAPAPADAPAPAPAAAPAPPQAAVTPQPAPAAAGVAPTAAAPVSAYLLSQRDEEPSERSPLVYRERTWVVPPGTTEDASALALRGELYGLQQQLAGRPDGKFVNLAVFDHAWTDRPLRAPLVTLQWKDWRGEPDVAFPARARAARASEAPRASATTAVAAPTASPVPAAPVTAVPVTAVPVTAVPVTAAPTAASVSSPPPAAPASQPPASQPPASQPPVARAAPISQPPTAQSAARAPAESPDDRLAHAFEACQDLFFLASASDGLDFVVRLLAEIVPCEAITASLYDINTDELRFVALTGPGAEARKGSAVQASRGLVAEASRRPAPILVDDVARDPRFVAEFDGRPGLEAQTMLLHGVLHEGRLLGVLQLTNRSVQPQFGRADGNVVTYVAKQLGAFLHTQRTADKRAPAGTTVGRPRR